MPARLPLPSTQLLLYGFGTEANFEGQLVGALERIESGGTLRVLEALLVQKDRDTGEFAAVAVRGHGIGGFVAPLLGFRLDATERRRATERASCGRSPKASRRSATRSRAMTSPTGPTQS
jgi:hypothetical protein